MPLLSLLTGGLGKIIGIGALAVSLLSGGLYLLHQHDNAVRAEMQVAADQAIAAAQEADAKKADEALTAAHAEAAKRIASITAIKEKTHVATPTTACAHSPAVRAMLDGLHTLGSNGPRTTP